MLPQWSIHRDERHFADPESFVPERWADRSPASTRAYFPFGDGPRVCIGRQLALTEATLVLADVAREWTVEVPDPPTSLRPSITAQPRGPVEATLHRRN
jgi:cytochrome P450